MSAKKWIILFFAAVIAALGVCAAFNMAVDPFGVFGDRIFHWYAYTETNNPRIAKVEYLKEHAQEYDSYIIGSSSSNPYQVEELNEYLDASFYNVFVYGSDTKDYCDMADYLVENCTVKNIILNIAINEANEYDEGNDLISHQEHPLVSGENRFLFTLRYAFCNLKYSREKIVSYFNDTELPQAFDIFDPETGSYDYCLKDVEGLGNPELYKTLHASNFEPVPQSDLPYIQECAQSVEYIKQLCAEHGVNLTVIFSPVYEDQWESCSEETLRSYKQALAQVTDYWDFSHTSLSYDARYFYDSTHFRNCVGTMVLSKIFGGDCGYLPEDFGVYVTAENVEQVNDAMFALKAPDVGSYTAEVPILLYAQLEGDGGAPAFSAEDLEAQLRAIQDAGYTTVSLAQLADYVNNGTPLPDQPICITFDDGYQSVYDLAYPILQKLGMTATAFATGVSIGCTTYKDTDFPITPHFSYAQANEMMDAGVVEMQSHTYDFRQWAPYESSTAVRADVIPLEGETDAAYRAALTQDTETYQAEYAAETGRTLYALSYPRGEYRMLSEVALHQAGISITLASDRTLWTDDSLVCSDAYANTLVKGLPQTLYAMSRYSVFPDTGTETLLNWLETGEA